MAYYTLDDTERERPEPSAGDYGTYGGPQTSYAPSDEQQQLPQAAPSSQPPKFYTPPNGNTGVSGYAGPASASWEELFKNFKTSQTPAQRPTPQFTGDYKSFFQGLAGDGPADRNILDQIEPMLSNIGVNVQRASDHTARGRLKLPTGEEIDVVQGRGWGDPWAWNPAGTNAGGGGSAYGASPVLDDAIAKLTQLFSQQNTGLEQFMGIANDRLKQLTDPAVTAAQRATMRTNLQEPIEAQRAAAQRHVLERASTRGMGLGSGVIEQEAQGVDQGFDRLLGEGFRGLSIDEMNRNDAHGQEAVNIGQIMAALSQAQQGMQANAANGLMGAGQYLTNLPIQQMLASVQSMNALDNQTIPQQQDMNGLIGLLMSLAGQGQNAYNVAGAQEGSFWNGLFGQLPGLIGAITGSSGDQYARNAGDYSPDGPNYA